MTCYHKNIYWNDLFKSEKQGNWNYKNENAFCLDCGTEKGRVFATACRLWFCRKVREWLISAKEELIEKDFGNRDSYLLFPYKDFDEFVKKNDFGKQWKELQLGGGDWNNEDFENPFGQSVFFEFAQSIEYLCQEFKKEKEQERSNNNNNDNSRERAKLKRKIKRLAKKTNKTPEELAELESLKKKLQELQLQDQSNNNSWLKPALIASGILILFILLIIYLVSKQKNK